MAKLRADPDRLRCSEWQAPIASWPELRLAFQRHVLNLDLPSALALWVASVFYFFL